MVPFADLVKPVSRAEVQAQIYELLGRVGVSTTSWRSGAVVRTLIVVFSTVFAALTVLISNVACAGFLELSAGKWLDQVAKYVFGETRFPATRATGKVTLTNTGGGDFTLGVDDLVLSSTRLKKNYRNVAGFNLPPGGTITIDVIAVEVGSASTALPGDVDRLETTLLNVTVTNTAAIVGTDEESDTSLKSRCSAKLGAASPNGPADAYAYQARKAIRLDGSPIGVTRVAHTKDGFGNLNIYVATPTGGVTGSAGNLATDLGIIDDMIQKRATALCVTAETLSGVPVVIPVVGQAWIYSDANLTPEQAATKLEAAHVDFISKQPISGNKLPGAPTGKVYLDQIRTVIGSAVPNYKLVHLELSSPSADVTLNTGETPVPGDVAITIHIVEPPGVAA